MTPFLLQARHAATARTAVLLFKSFNGKPQASASDMQSIREIEWKCLIEAPSKVIAVGTDVSIGPPHRSVREALPHTAPTLSRS